MRASSADPALKLDYLNPQTNHTSFGDRRKHDRSWDRDRGRQDDDRWRDWIAWGHDDDPRRDEDRGRGRDDD